MEYFKSKKGIIDKDKDETMNKNIVSSKTDYELIVNNRVKRNRSKLKLLNLLKPDLPTNLNINEDMERIELAKDAAIKQKQLEEQRKKGFPQIDYKEEIDKAISLLSENNNYLKLNEKAQENVIKEIIKRIKDDEDFASNNFVTKNELVKLNEVVNDVVEEKVNDVVEGAKDVVENTINKKVDDAIIEKANKDKQEAELAKTEFNKKKEVLDNYFNENPTNINKEKYDNLKKLDFRKKENKQQIIKFYDNLNNKGLLGTQGEGLFDSISKMVSSIAPKVLNQAKIIAPSVLTALNKPEVKQAAFNYVKGKLKKKEPIKITRDEELFTMFKNKEITLQEYKELKELNKQNQSNVETNIETKNETTQDDNLKSLNGKLSLKKIYLDLLNKKYITPEVYMTLTTGREPNIKTKIDQSVPSQQPIDNINSELKPEIKDIAEIPKTNLGEGLTKQKRKYKKSKK